MRQLPRSIRFFATDTGNEPVREWLKAQPKEERRIIGEDVKTAQATLHWRKPLVDSFGNGLWEVRSTLPSGIARILFFEHRGEMILLHAFKKKTQKTPEDAIKLAHQRKREYEKAAEQASRK